MLPLLILLLVVIPMAWFVSEFSKYRSLRLVLGILAIATTTFSVWAVNDLLTTINYNSSYGTATKKLVETSIAQIEAGRQDRVLKAWRAMDVQYDATYETQPGRYVALVEDATARMTDNIPADVRSVEKQSAPK
jgi:hypothetical protein